MKSLKESRAYVGGTFDLFHYGHIELLRLCKETFGTVIVSLNTDEFSEEYKKVKPYYPLHKRIEIVSSCKYVDEIVVNEGGADSTIAIAKVKPDYIVHGNDWTEYPLMVQMGLTINFMIENQIRFYYFPYTIGISSTQLRGKTVLPLQAVVARFNENVDWVNKFGIPTIIYTKTPMTQPDSSIIVKDIPIDDSGREASTYLTHIINSYDNLASYTLFLQGRVDDHCPHLKEMLNFKNDFTWLGDTDKEDNWGFDAYGTVADFYMKLFPNKDKPTSFKFKQGGMFMVSKKAIQSNPKQFYEDTLHLAKEHYNGMTHHPWATSFERIWEKIFTN